MTAAVVHKPPAPAPAEGAAELSNQPDLALTEHEGMLLSLLLRMQPTTAHQLYKMFETSPVTSINASKGQLYPAIRRLKARALLESRPLSGDGRRTEELAVSDLGAAAVRGWVRNIDTSHVVLDDPLRTRVLSFDVLSREEQLEWIARAKALVKAKRDTVESYNQSVEVPHQAFAYRSVIDALGVKMECLDELLYEVAAPD